MEAEGSPAEMERDTGIEEGDEERAKPGRYCAIDTEDHGDG